MYLRSANGDDSFAIYNLGYCHGRGKGVRKDVSKVAEFYSRVAGADVPGVTRLMFAMTTERGICWDQAGRAGCRYGANFVTTEGISRRIMVCADSSCVLGTRSCIGLIHFRGDIRRVAAISVEALRLRPTTSSASLARKKFRAEARSRGIRMRHGAFGSYADDTAMAMALPYACGSAFGLVSLCKRQRSYWFLHAYMYERK
jgi:hypothetical protein